MNTIICLRKYDKQWMIIAAIGSYSMTCSAGLERVRRHNSIYEDDTIWLTGVAAADAAILGLRQSLLGNQCRQLQQVFNAEVRASGRRPHERIRRRQARPIRRQESQPTLVITVTDAVLSPGEILVYERELTPVKGVKHMSNPECLCLIKRNRCS